MVKLYVLKSCLINYAQPEISIIILKKSNFQDTCTVYKAGCFDICSTIFLILSLQNYRGQAMTQSP